MNNKEIHEKLSELNYNIKETVTTLKSTIILKFIAYAFFVFSITLVNTLANLYIITITHGLFFMLVFLIVLSIAFIASKKESKLRARLHRLSVYKIKFLRDIYWKKRLDKQNKKLIKENQKNDN